MVGWAWACVHRIAQDVSAAEPVVLRRGEPAEDGRVLKWLGEGPSTLSEKLYLISAQLDIWGASVWDESWRPLWRPRFADGVWRGTQDGAPRVLRPEEALVFRLLDPETGAPRPTLAALADPRLVDQMTWRYIRRALENGFLVPFALMGDFSEDDAEVILDQLREFHQGPERAGKPLILPAEVRIERLATLDPGSAVANLPHDQIRDYILGVFGVPASKLGLVKDVNRANAEANDRTYRLNVLLPRLRLIGRVLSQKARERWGVEVRLRLPDTEDPMSTLERLEVAVRAGIMSPNEARRELGLPPTEWGEVPPRVLQVLAAQGFYVPSLEPKGLGAEVKKALYRREATRLRAGLEERLRAELRKVMVGEIYPVLLEAKDQRSLHRAVARAREVAQGYPGIEGVAKALAAAAEAGVNFGAAQLGKAYAKDMEPLVVRILTDAETLYSLAVESVLDDVVRAAEEFDGEDFLGALAEAFERATDRSSLLGARLGVTREFTQGQLETYSSEGVRRKVWVTAMDERVRDTHAAMEGVAVPVEEDFVLPGGAKGPGPGLLDDMSENWNCRCLLAPGV